MNIPITVKTSKSEFNDVISRLKSLKINMESGELAEARANRYKEYTQMSVEHGILGLEKISELTAFLEGGNHDPMWITGELLKRMQVRKKGKTALVGYFGDSNEPIPGKEIGWTDLAKLHHTGYRIPLRGKEGLKVRKWFAAQGIFISKGLDVITVKARPFMENALFRFLDSGEDFKIGTELFNKVVKEIV